MANIFKDAPGSTFVGINQGRVGKHCHESRCGRAFPRVNSSRFLSLADFRGLTSAHRQDIETEEVDEKSFGLNSWMPSCDSTEDIYPYSWVEFKSKTK